MKKISTLFFTFLFTAYSYGQMVTLGKEFFVSLEAWGLAGFSFLSKENATISIHYFDDPDLDTTVTLTPNVFTQFRLDFSTTASISDHIPGEIDQKSAVICSDLPFTRTFGDVMGATEDVAAIYPIMQPPLANELYSMNTIGSSGRLGVRRAALIISHYDNVCRRVSGRLSHYPTLHSNEVPG